MAINWTTSKWCMEQLYVMKKFSRVICNAKNEKNDKKISKLANWTCNQMNFHCSGTKFKTKNWKETQCIKHKIFFVKKKLK
jgi:hypothetical protein